MDSGCRSPPCNWTCRWTLGSEVWELIWPDLSTHFQEYPSIFVYDIFTETHRLGRMDPGTLFSGPPDPGGGGLRGLKFWLCNFWVGKVSLCQISTLGLKRCGRLYRTNKQTRRHPDSHLYYIDSGRCGWACNLKVLFHYKCLVFQWLVHSLQSEVIPNVKLDWIHSLKEPLKFLSLC